VAIVLQELAAPSVPSSPIARLLRWLIALGICINCGCGTVQKENGDTPGDGSVATGSGGAAGTADGGSGGAAGNVAMGSGGTIAGMSGNGGTGGNAGVGGNGCTPAVWDTTNWDQSCWQ
jgi:hypothetical protein